MAHQFINNIIFAISIGLGVIVVMVSATLGVLLCRPLMSVGSPTQAMGPSALTPALETPPLHQRHFTPVTYEDILSEDSFANITTPRDCSGRDAEDTQPGRTNRL